MQKSVSSFFERKQGILIILLILLVMVIVKLQINSLKTIKIDVKKYYYTNNTALPLEVNITQEEKNTKSSKFIRVTVNGAEDENSGLANEAYSFDNGLTWQSENYKDYTKKEKGVIIKVKDSVGNEYTHESIDVEINGILGPEIVISEIIGKNVYPTLLKVDLKDDDGLSYLYLEGDNGYITLNGEKEITETYNRTKNGPVTIIARDIYGNETSKTYEVKNVIEFITSWQVNENETITLPIAREPDIYIDWGDGIKESKKVIQPTHTYTKSGIYDVKITGIIPEWNFDKEYVSKDKIVQIKQWGVNEFNSLHLAFRGCINLTNSIPALINNDSFKKVVNFSGIFSGCSKLTGSIPSNLFSNCPKVTDFSYIFNECSKLTGNIPENLFKNCQKVTDFTYAFAECSNIAGSIPSNLFSNCSKVASFHGIFRNCSKLTGSIPENLFVNCKNVVNFAYTFWLCIGLTGNIPENLFKNCPEVTDFKYVFNGCSGLIGSIPENLFANNEKVISFKNTFNGCSMVSGSIPANLFNNCSNVEDFRNLFGRCSKLTGNIPENLFKNCQKVTDFSYTFRGCVGLTGNAPDLWNKTKWPKVTENMECFYNCTKLSNYSSIPTGWK